ncbi:UDP-N-acetylglucosamine 2-epimerase [Paenibacillus daejeonensis]|uniref:UDP-N-acetylglucosamine 2-epimerase n=1 Tax=Paenibacillus daejeonensis TaxID=135193 RepID=UPI00037878B9|nr:UDP-N-acetylglucosamine 2-epimerase [Paenibacillus daejeonensis]
MSRPVICVVTGSRADYGLLQGVLSLLAREESVELQLVVTGMHLASEHGSTWRQIEADGYTITDRIETLLTSDTPAGVSKAMALGIIGFADLFSRNRPAWVVVLGDRFEIYAAALAAFNARLRIAHIAGGDVTGGALDDGYRHGITKLAHLHLVSHEQARLRVIQLGEAPANVLNVGHPGIDTVRTTPLLSRQELESLLNCTLQPVNLLVTFHPPTLSEMGAGSELDALLEALSALDPQTGLFFTGSNSDAQGRQLRAGIEAFVENRPYSWSFVSLGSRKYLSLVQAVDAVVGNSSSGLLEVPSLGKATVDVGSRQQGRFRGNSVIHCEANAPAITAAIHQALSMERSGIANPYGDGHSSERIVDALLARLSTAHAGPKFFYEVKPHASHNV